MSSNKTLKNAQPRSPRPASRNRVRELSLRGITLQSISSMANRPQSRNNRLSTNVQEIKGKCNELHTQLRRMQRESEAQCEELYEKLKKTDGKEIDDLKGLLKKCNDEKEVLQNYIDKDKEAFRKLNKKLEETIRKVKDEKITKYEETIRKVKEEYRKEKAIYEETIRKVMEEYRIMEAYRNESLIMQQLEKDKKEKEEYKTGKSHGNLYTPSEEGFYNNYTPSQLRELFTARPEGSRFYNKYTYTPPSELKKLLIESNRYTPPNLRGVNKSGIHVKSGIHL